MASRTPPRHVPTLTEIVNTQLAATANRIAPVPPTVVNAPVQTPAQRSALAQEVIAQVRPQLEAELRSIALELFEAQFSTLLPSLHLQIEEAVREAIERNIS